MTKTIAYLVNNNGFTALIIKDVNGYRMHTIGDATTFRDAVTVGDGQDLNNWSGELLDDDVTAEDCGNVLAINDGAALTVLDTDALAERRRFFCGEDA